MLSPLTCRLYLYLDEMSAGQSVVNISGDSELGMLSTIKQDMNK